MKNVIGFCLIAFLIGCAQQGAIKSAASAEPVPSPSDDSNNETSPYALVKDSNGNTVAKFLGYSGALNYSVRYGLLLLTSGYIVNVDMMTGEIKAETMVFLTNDCSGIAYAKPLDVTVPLITKNRVLRGPVNTFYKVTGLSGSALTGQSVFDGTSCSASSVAISATTPVMEAVATVDDMSAVAPITLEF